MPVCFGVPDILKFDRRWNSSAFVFVFVFVFIGISMVCDSSLYYFFDPFVQASQSSGVVVVLSFSLLANASVRVFYLDCALFSLILCRYVLVCLIFWNLIGDEIPPHLVHNLHLFVSDIHNVGFLTSIRICHVLRISRLSLSSYSGATCPKEYKGPRVFMQSDWLRIYVISFPSLPDPHFFLCSAYVCMPSTAVFMS